MQKSTNIRTTKLFQFGVLLPSFLIVLLFFFAMVFIREPLTEHEREAAITFNALDDSYPRFGRFQLGATTTESKLDNFENHYRDNNDKRVNVDYSDNDHTLYKDTVELKSEQHVVYPNIESTFSVQFKDSQLIYIKQVFFFKDTGICEVAFEQFTDQLKTDYGQLIHSDELPKVKLYAQYSTYYETDVIDKKFAAGSEHDCGHKTVKDVVIRLGFLPDVVNKIKIDDITEFTSSFR